MPGRKKSNLGATGTAPGASDQKPPLGWVSLKQPRKLFKAYLESVRAFKDRYYFIQPVSEWAILSLFDNRVWLGPDEQPLLGEDGTPKRQLVQRFSFHWTMEHFDYGNDQRDFFLLPCFLQLGFFGSSSLIIHRAESLALEGLDRPTKRAQLAKDASALMRVWA